MVDRKTYAYNGEVMPGNAANVMEIAAAIVSDSAGRLLLVRKHNTSIYMQPGGKIDAGRAH